MTEILFVCDGPRDHVTAPWLVGTVLGTTIQPRFGAWARLHHRGSGSGYSRKLRFAIDQAKDAKAVALVATVDADTDPQRRKLRELRKGRDEDRASSPPFPTVLAEAVPHGEAWLLDDPVAVRQGLALAKDFEIPNVQKVQSPKSVLEELKAQSERSQDDTLVVLADIAKLVEPSRCVHSKETGFHGLMNEIHDELRPFAGLS